MTITIFEGPDCAGKSTLIEAFSALSKEPVHLTHHGSYNGLSGHQMTEKYIESMEPGQSGKVFLDRCWLSDPIYGKIYRKEPSRLSKAQVNFLEVAAASGSAIIVLCMPPLSEIVPHFEKRIEGELLDNVGQLRAVYYMYESKFKELTGLDVVTYDYTSQDPKELFLSIEERRKSV